MKTLGAILWTAGHKVFGRLVMDSVTRFCGNDSVLIRAFHEMVRQWFATGTIRVLRRTNCNPIMSFLVIACVAGVDWDAVDVEWFPPVYEGSNIF